MGINPLKNAHSAEITPGCFDLSHQATWTAVDGDSNGQTDSNGVIWQLTPKI